MKTLRNNIILIVLVSAVVSSATFLVQNSISKSAISKSAKETLAEVSSLLEMKFFKLAASVSTGDEHMKTIDERLKVLEERDRGLEVKIDVLKQHPVFNVPVPKKPSGKEINGQAMLIRNNGDKISVIRSDVFLYNEIDGQSILSLYNKAAPLLSQSAALQEVNSDRSAKLENISSVRELGRTIIKTRTPLKSVKTDSEGSFHIPEIQEKVVWIVVLYSTDTTCGMWIEKINVDQEKPSEIVLDSGNIKFISQM